MATNVIVNLAQEAGFQIDGDSWIHAGPVLIDGRKSIDKQLERFAALVAAAERDSFITEMQAQVDHAVINDLRLVPNFGKKQGDLAVRVGNIEAVLDAIRARSQQ
jgi:hypothetical protein